MLYILGPSHLHPSVADAETLDEFRRSAYIEGHCGMCNFSQHCKDVLDNVLDVAAGRPVVWMVIDWRIGNYDWKELLDRGISQTPSKPGNIHPAFITNDIDEFLIDAQISMLRERCEAHPNLRLAFWCCYVRSVLGVSWPERGKYDAVVKTFADRVIDVRRAISPEDVPAHIIDAGGHMTPCGLRKVLSLLCSEAASVTRQSTPQP